MAPAATAAARAKVDASAPEAAVTTGALSQFASASPAGAISPAAAGRKAQTAAQQEAAPVTPQPHATTRGATLGYWESSATGWALALAILASVRAGRWRADADRFDVALLQSRQQESRMQSKELREKRRQYLEEQRRAKEAEAARRLEEAKQRAAEEAAARAERRAQEAAEAAKELERMRREREAARQEFERGQSMMDEELQKRIRVEEELYREKERQRAEAEAAARAAAEEARRLEEEEARRREEEERRRREAAERQRRERRAMLRAQQTAYELQLSGSAAAGPAPPGSTTSGTPAVPARLRVDVTVSVIGSARSAGAASSSTPDVSDSQVGADGGSETTTGASGSSGSSSSSGLYESPEAAVEDASALASQTARHLAARLSSSPSIASCRPPTAPGAPIAPLCFPELQLWSWLLSLKVEATVQLAVGQVAALAAGGKLEQPFEVYSRIGVLPEDNLSAVGRMLMLAAAQARAGQAEAAVQLLNDIIDRLQEDLESTGPPLGYDNAGGASGEAAVGGGRPPLSPYLVPACVYAQLLDLCEDPFADSARQNGEPEPGASAAGGGSGADSSSSSSSGSSSSSSSSSDLRRLVEFQLGERTKRAAPDSLTGPAASFSRLIGRQHPVAKLLSRLAESNMSPGARQAREMRRQQATVAASMEVLKRQGSLLAAPGGLDPSSSRARGAPVPEKAWAARNVARSLVAGGDAAGAEEGVRMLREAAEECRDYYGERHPGQLSTLLDLIEALMLLLQWRPEAAEEAAEAIEHALQIVQAVGERYRAQGDIMSLVLLYESTQAELDYPQVIPRDDKSMSRIVRQASDAFAALETNQAARVVAKRCTPAGSPSSALRALARDCTEEPLVQRATRRSASRLDQWNKDLPLAPLA